MHDKNKRVKLFCLICFVVYMAFLIYYLIFSDCYDRNMANRTYRYNLVLFREIRRFWVNRATLGFRVMFENIFGNFLGFIPFGFLLPVFFKKMRSFALISFLSFDFTLMIELVQLVFRVGIFDVDDILLNTLGGMAGYLLFLAAYGGRLHYYGRKARKKK
jgi:glycopeptide antibiotics resistance protein